MYRICMPNSWLGVSLHPEGLKLACSFKDFRDLPLP